MKGKEFVVNEGFSVSIFLLRRPSVFSHDYQVSTLSNKNFLVLRTSFSLKWSDLTNRPLQHRCDVQSPTGLFTTEELLVETVPGKVEPKVIRNNENTCFVLLFLLFLGSVFGNDLNPHKNP